VFRAKVAPMIERDDVGSTEPESAAPTSPVMAPPSAEVASAAPLLADRTNKGARAAKADAPLGTGFGQRERDEVHDVDFERASSEPDQVITLYYDTRAHLIARGVLPEAPTWPREPEVFPGRFVPDPPSGDSR
jgi:hypothetical protein